MTDKEKQIATEIDGVKYALNDTLLGVKIALKRLEELEATLQDKQEDKF